jgi:hypothetical protein
VGRPDGANEQNATAAVLKFVYIATYLLIYFHTSVELLTVAISNKQ